MADRASDQQGAALPVTVGTDPYNAETPSEALVHGVTPTASAYVRTNFGVPSLDPAAHGVAVAGRVRAPLVLDAAALRALPHRELVATMECAGNDRLALRPLPHGEPWHQNAVATAVWAGVPLAGVLERAGVLPDALQVVATGADAGPRADAPEPGPVSFARALPLDVAMAPDTLLATHMNGEPLTPAHGAPVRLIVPGWYGMANVKWLARLDVVATPFDGYFQRHRYVVDEGDGAATPLSRMRVKSALVEPANGARVGAGRVTLWGWAWSGEGPVTSVEVAIGGGDTWRRADLEPPAGPYAWARWSLDVTFAVPGRYVVRTRAADATGARQPEVPTWNRLGYGNNAVRAVVLDVLDPPPA